MALPMRTMLAAAKFCNPSALLGKMNVLQNVRNLCYKTERSPRRSLIFLHLIFDTSLLGRTISFDFLESDKVGLDRVSVC